MSEGGACVTKSDAEEWRELKAKRAHLTVIESLKFKSKEFDSLLEGEHGIVTIKTNLRTQIQHLEILVAFRIVEDSHPLQKSKYRLWPLYVLVTIDDYHLGVTHVLRGKRSLNNTEKQKWIYKYMGWEVPQFIHYGLVSIPKTNLKD